MSLDVLRRATSGAKVGITTLTSIVLLLVADVLVALQRNGWRSHVMTTPSMGRDAPVGTLVLSRRVDASRVHVGEVIVFHPPGRTDTTFVHRVVSVSRGPDGPLIRTKGDINGSVDPWVLRSRDLIGKATTRLPDGGFLLQMLPLLLAGIFALIFLTYGMRRAVRGPARVLGTALLCAAMVAYYRPLDRLALIGEASTPTGGDAAVVPTGVLPVKVEAVGGRHVNLAPGQVGALHLNHIPASGAFELRAHVALSGWWWLLACAWILPLIAALRYSVPRSTPPERSTVVGDSRSRSCASPVNVRNTNPSPKSTSAHGG